MLGNGVYLMQGLNKAFAVVKTSKAYKVTHIKSGEVAYCSTQRKVRNIMRSKMTKGTMSTKGRE